MVNTLLMDTTWHRIDNELSARGKNWAWLARELGTSDQTVHNWSTRGVPARRLVDIASTLDWTVEQLTGVAPRMSGANNRHGQPSVAHSMSQSDLHDAPQELEWGALVNVAISGKFQVRVPDDAVAPAVRAGTLCTFDPSVNPRPGDGVLVKDGAGRFHFRRWREAEPGEWEAYGTSDAYRTYHSRRDGIERVGVLVAMEQRLG